MNVWLRSCRRTWGPLLAQRRAGALSPAEAERLDRHLAGCARCRALAADLDVLKRAFADAARSELLDHPEPEELAALAEGGAALAAAERERLERHLERCAICRSEWNTARSWSPPPAPAPAPAPRGAAVSPLRWRWFGAGAVTAGAAAALAAVLLWPPAVAPDGAGLRPSAPPIQIRGSHHRAGNEPTALRLPPAGDLLVSVTVEAAPGSALRVELLRRDGSVVSSGPLVAADPAGLVFVSVPAASVPREGGVFRVAVEATGETFDYPFRIADASD